MNTAAALSFVCGFASLSIEILWVRLYGFSKHSTPGAFGFVLAAYLLGIAIGAAAGARACRRVRADDDLWRFALAALVLSSALTPILPHAYAVLKSRWVEGPIVDLSLMAFASAVLSFVFPIAHHLGTRRDGTAQGQRFARVYTANVAGAALGPLVTGYVLLDYLTVQHAFAALGVLQAVAAACLALAATPRLAWRAAVAGAGVTAAIVGGTAAAGDPHALLKPFHLNGGRPKAVVENRHGVVTMFPGAGGDDVVVGGNVYDGRTNLDPVRNTNGLERPLLAIGLHPQPRRVLMVGLSIGTWLAVVGMFPGVESIDVVEINPGYLKALQPYPAQAAATRDPRVRIVVDDARRWLRRHPERTYDVIIMNTTLHWRANATMLLSREMLSLARARLNPGGLLAFNATGSHDAFYTATRVFPHAYRYSNFVYAAEFDFRARRDDPGTAATYSALRLAGKPFFTDGDRTIRGFLRIPFFTVESDQRDRPARPFEEITDENMITEFRYGRTLYYWLDFLP